MSKDVLWGIVVAIVTGLLSWSLAEQYKANADLADCKARLAHLESDTRRDDSQDKQLGMMWKYFGWLHWEVDDTRTHDGLPVNRPPNLE